MEGVESDTLFRSTTHYPARSRSVTRRLIFLLSLLAFLPAEAKTPTEIQADWIQHQYKEAFKGSWELERPRAIEYAIEIQAVCAIYGLNFDRFFAQVAWESSFVNNIKDRKLVFRKWSYGLTGIQLGTARDLTKNGNLTGRILIQDFKMNINLGAMQMNEFLRRTNFDEDRAEMAYNAGWEGMKQGRGADYPSGVETTMKKWLKFKGESYVDKYKDLD